MFRVKRMVTFIYFTCLENAKILPLLWVSFTEPQYLQDKGVIWVEVRAIQV